MPEDRKLSGLSPRQREVLKRMLSANGAQASRGAAPIPRVPRDGPLPVSPVQRRLWFLDQWNPGSSLYNVPLLVRVRDAPAPGALQQALDVLAQRHETLRTTFGFIDGDPVQIVAPGGRVQLRVEDLCHLPPAEREAAVRRLLDEEIQRPFDLSAGPLLRSTVLLLGPAEYILSVVMHHIISDIWSLSVLTREIAVIYDAIRYGVVPALPELPVQYADFADWQRRRLESGQLESDLAYWKRHLGGMNSLLELPTDRPRPPIEAHQGAAERTILPSVLSNRLREFSRSRGVTLFTTLLAAFLTLLHRYTGQDDLAVGTPVAGRNHADVENLIGFFVNTLVLRTSVAGNPPFTDLVGRVHSVVLDALEHQGVPFELLVEELQPARGPDHHPLFQVSFAVDNIPPKLRDDPGRGEVIEPEIRTAKFDLSFDIRDSRDGLRTRAEYSTDLFQPATVVRMLAHYQTLIESIIANPAASLPALNLLTPAEHRQLQKWNRTTASYPLDRCVHELFEAQAGRTPDAPAVVAGSASWSFDELNRRANRLADHLRRLGAVPGSLIGLYLEPSLDLVAALLGVLKAGCAYVPLDSSYPDAHTRFVAEDAGISILLARDEQRVIPAAGSVRVVRLTSVWRELAAGDARTPPSAAAPESPAYVIYTSGTTGRPKGVVVPHRALVNHMCWMLEEFPLTPGDRVLQRTSPSFDASVWEFFAPLLSGARLVIPGAAERRDPTAKVELMERQRMTIVQMTPSLLRVVADSPGFGRVRSLRRIFSGGESLSGSLVRRLAQQTEAEITNLYGPTEACIDTAFHHCSRDEPKGAVPIGRPIRNVQLRVLDAHQEPVPVGVTGELWIGGVGLASEYLNRPELTAEKFRTSGGQRWFRTGDLVRFRSDGSIDLLGRLDNQVKIRGHRIELEGIEAVLRRHESVQDAVVVARDDAGGEKALAAYVTGPAGPLPDPDELRRYLTASLPGFMAPSWIVPLRTLPRTPNGKVDRTALPPPPTPTLDLQAPDLPPRDEIEIRLIKIWERVLKIRPIGLRDNFFALGGHSLLAVTLFAEIEKAFGARMPLATLFESPTVEGLAAALRRGSYRQQWSSLVPLQPLGEKPPFFCVHANGGNVLMYRDLAKHMAPDQPFYGLQSAGLDGTEPTLTRIEDMARRYIDELRTVQPEGPYSLGGFCMGAYVALEMAGQLQQEGQQVALLVAINTDGAWKTVRSFRDGLRLHALSLRRLSLVGKLTYLSERVAYRAFRTATTLASVIWEFRRNPAGPIPSRLALLRLFETNSEASSHSRPSVFRGGLVFFQGSGDAHADPEPFWNQAVSGGIEIHVVPGKYESVLEDPNVAVLEEKLRSCLDRAHRPVPVTNRGNP